jgi:poly(A) polymerase
MMKLTAPWLTLPAVQHLFDIFEKEGATLRLVGGSVRDGLLNLSVSDIDFAVDKNPNWVMQLLKSHHIKCIPTGIDHGTVTAVIDRRPYQITTLRLDVETFGRKANVEFTNDWAQDAQRRDFTINAIYADKNGDLFDPVNGVQDLENHIVRFIGEASLRIKEDYLRILRFFRFSARFGHEPYDAEGLKACSEFASHLPHLARERVTDEFMKLLTLPSPLYTLEAMNETGVLAYILHPGTWDVLKVLITLEKGLDLTIFPLQRLAAFHPVIEEVRKHLRLSNKQTHTLAFLSKSHPLVTKETFKQQAYYAGREETFELAVIQTAQRISNSNLSLPEGEILLQNLFETFKDWEVPEFPLTGNDLLEAGIKEGKDVGRLLRTLEQWWLSQGLSPDRKTCLSELSRLL